jgi:hypothetical protein
VQATSGTQQPASGSSRKEKEKQREELQRRHKIDTATEMLQVVMETVGVRCV